MNWMKCSTIASLSLRFLVSVPSAPMSFFSGGAASVTQPAVVTARLPNDWIASPIGLRSCASPETNCWSLMMKWFSCGVCALTVPSTLLRLSITSPITLSLPAIVVVSDGVCASRLSTVLPAPCRTWITSEASSVTVDADVVVGQKQRRVTEPRLVAVRVGRVDVRDADAQDRGQQHGDDDEDAELDQRCDQSPHGTVTSAPR